MEKERKKKAKGEKISEIFEVEKGGKTRIIETHKTEEEKPASEAQLKKENKILGKIIFAMVGFVAMFVIVYLIINSMGKFEVNGVKFQTVKEGQLILYKTSIPVLIANKTEADYNFYLRTDPRMLDEKAPTTGNITFRKNMVLDVTTQDLFCGGDWAIGLANVQKLYSLLGFNLLVRNESMNKLDYLPENQYMFVTINKGNQTEIREINGNTYEINISNCEVLPAFEKFMLEAFMRYQKIN